MASKIIVKSAHNAAKVLAAFVICLFAAGCGGGGDQGFPGPAQQYQSLRIAPMNASVRTGVTGRFVAVAIRADQSADASWYLSSPAGAANWKSSSPATVSIDSLGHFNATSAGRTTISATLGTLTASTALVVDDASPTLTNVEIDPGLPKLGDNGVIVGQQYYAIAKYDDGATKDITADGTWVSSDISAATVDATGMVTYRSRAECTITFYYGLSYNSFRIVHL